MMYYKLTLFLVVYVASHIVGVEYEGEIGEKVEREERGRR